MSEVRPVQVHTATFNNALRSSVLSAVPNPRAQHTAMRSHAHPRMSRWNTPALRTSASSSSPSAVSNTGLSTGRMPEASKSSVCNNVCVWGGCQSIDSLRLDLRCKPFGLCMPQAARLFQQAARPCSPWARAPRDLQHQRQLCKLPTAFQTPLVCPPNTLPHTHKCAPGLMRPMICSTSGSAASCVTPPRSSATMGGSTLWRSRRSSNWDQKVARSLMNAIWGWVQRTRSS